MTSTNSARHFRPNAWLRLASAGTLNFTNTPRMHFFHPIISPSDGKMRVCAMARAAPLAPLRLALYRLALYRLAPLRLAPLRLAPLRLAPLRLALYRLAPLRLAPYRLALYRLAPYRSAPLRL